VCGCISKWPAMDRPISFRESTAPHLSAVAYIPGDWMAANWRDWVVFTPFSIWITVVTLAITGWSLPSNRKLSKSCTVWQKLHAPSTMSKLRKNCMAQDCNFLGSTCLGPRNYTVPNWEFLVPGINSKLTISFKTQ